MSLDGIVTFATSPGPKIACSHEGEGKHCTKCGVCIHPEVAPLTPGRCRRRHKTFCAQGDDHCPNCGKDVSIFRFLEIA